MLTVDVSPGNSGNVKVDETAWSSYPFSVLRSDCASTVIEAMPAAGYHFEAWGGNLSGTDNPVTILMDSDKTFIAHFSRMMHNLTIEVNGSGTTTPAAGDQEYFEGEVVEITAKPDSGWRFINWTGDVARPNSRTTTVTIKAEQTIVANFTQSRFNGWLIGGIAAGVVIIGLVAWLVVQRLST
jgi:hypothetical protein